MFKQITNTLAIAIFLSITFFCKNNAAQTTKQPLPSKPLVLMVSLDGFKPIYLSASATPNLFRLSKQGVMAQGLLSSFPSLTFPNHLTLVTGQTPDQHGIVNNTMTDPNTSQRFSLSSREAVTNTFWWQEAQPLWVTLRQQGKKASTLFWPGSEVPIQGLMPNDWLPYQHNLPHETRIATLMQWLSRPEEDRPDFATLYFSDVDSAGHADGPDSQAVKVATEKVDKSIGQLITQLNEKGLMPHTTLVIVSDHGMVLVPDHQVIQVKDLLSGYPEAKWEWLGPTSGVRLNGAPQENVMSTLSTLPHATCWPKQKVPKKFRFGSHRRIPDIICLAEVGYSISDNPDRKGPVGQHGHDPAHPDMHGILIVVGPGIHPTQLGLVENIEIYGLLAHLLGIKQEKNTPPSSLPQLIFK